VKQVHGAGDADELGDHVGVVDHHQQHHEHKGEAQAEFLADEVAEALAGYYPHAGAHLLHHDQGDGDGNDGPQQGVSVLRAGLGVGEDAAESLSTLAVMNPGPRTARNSRIRIRQRFHMTTRS